MNTEALNTTLHPDYKSEIAQLIRSKLTPKLLREKLLDYHENDIAATLEELHREERNKLYRILDIDTLAAVLEYAEDFNSYLEELPVRTRIEILSRIEVSAAVNYLESLEKRERNTVMELIPAEPRREISTRSFCSAPSTRMRSAAK